MHYLTDLYNIKMLIFILISGIILHVNSEEKIFGEFTLDLEAVDHPVPTKNDMINYRFVISKTNRYEHQLTAKFQVFEKLTDLKAQTEVSKKSKKMASTEYQILRPMSAPNSFCSKTEKVYPVFQRLLEPKIDEEDCSMEKGDYILHPYSVEEELKAYVGNKYYYGGYRYKVIIVDAINQPVFGFQVYFTIRDANSTMTNPPPKSKSKPKKIS